MYSIFKTLLEQKGVSANDVCKATGIHASAITSWKQGISTPNSKKLMKIAEYFGVPLEYLMTGEMPSGDGYYLNESTAEIAQALFENKEMRLLFDAARDASPEDLEMVADLLNRLKRREKKIVD